MIYNSHASKQKVAKLLHKYMHMDALLVNDLLVGITELDALLYSTQMRERIKARLQNTDNQSVTFLNDPIQTRIHLYRFHLKGSNSLSIVLYYLQEKYNIRPSVFPSNFESDWDTTILINPFINPQTFNVIFNTLIPYIQQFMINVSRKISSSTYFHQRMENALKIGTDIINIHPEFLPYRKYPLTYKKDKISLLRIHDDSNELLEVQKYVQQLGFGGTGLYVTSNRNGGVPLGNIAPPKFFLGRIMASVIASRSIWLPVELLDISMNYQNEDLKFAWESYSEYHIQYLAHDFRVSSPTSLYFDISKCIRNASYSKNQTKKNKVSTRLKRLQTLLDNMIVPYKNLDNVIKSNLEKHELSSDELVKNIRRGITRKN
jgi:hypothetical protein